MGRRAIAIALADEDGEPLEARARTAPYGRGPWRAGIPLLKADGHAAVDIADRVGLSRKSVMVSSRSKATILSSRSTTLHGYNGTDTYGDS